MLDGKFLASLSEKMNHLATARESARESTGLMPGGIFRRSGMLLQKPVEPEPKLRELSPDEILKKADEIRAVKKAEDDEFRHAHKVIGV